MLMTTQSAAESTEPLVQAAASLGIPLKLLTQPLKKLNALYGCNFALIRPDHYIAWCGDSLGDALGALGLVTGQSLCIWGHQPPAVFAQRQGLTAPAPAVA